MIVLFDLDHTLIKGNSSFLFVKYLTSKKVISKKNFLFIVLSYLAYLIGCISLTNLHRFAFYSLFKGQTLSLIEEHLEPFFKDNLLPLIDPGIALALENEKKQGRIVALASSSPIFIVKKIAEALRIEDYTGTAYLLDKNGCFEEISEIVVAEQKRTYLYQLEQKYGKRTSKAYSDSSVDLDLFLHVDVPVLVNPRSFFFHRFAKKRGWEILIT